jgi:hypothetical protein
MVHETLSRFIDCGVSVIVGTVDADGIPSCCRGIAVTSKDAFETVTVYIPSATGQETIANIATTRRVAISCNHPLTHESIQIKGIARGVKLAAASEEAFVTSQLEAFSDVLDAIGLPRRITRGTAHWPAFALEVSVEQLFDQTPGPKAGAAIA